jgi:hypothetical protein
MINCPFTIIIDTAEQHPFGFQGMKEDSDKDYELMNVPTVYQALGRHPESLGDYSIVGGVGACHVERKSMEDLQSTLLGFEDGHRARFESELANLSKIAAPLLVVECSKEAFLLGAPEYGKRSRQQNAKILYRSVIAMEQDYRVQIEWSGSRQMAEMDCFRWIYRFWEKNLKPTRKKRTQPAVTTSSMIAAEQLLESI